MPTRKKYREKGPRKAALFCIVFGHMNIRTRAKKANSRASRGDVAGGREINMNAANKGIKMPLKTTRNLSAPAKILADLWYNVNMLKNNH